MFMTVDLQRDRGDVLLAPEQSIVPEGTRQYVFVINDGIAEKRQVQLGRRIPGYVWFRMASPRVKLSSRPVPTKYVMAPR
jgi:multidrug efflux pump subunit AcrA (membrane-fusion protein)